MARPRKLPAALGRSLKTVFGLDALRAGQGAVIERVMAGQDTLALMPTGAGKSLCYQLPSLHLNGMTVVVSPLIALMRDQVGKLADAGLAVDQLNSAVPACEQTAALARIEAGASDIVFATPERLVEPAFLARLKRQPIALFVIDEAHCISQWGHDFRPAFLEVGQVLKALGDPPLLALTATAPPEVVADIRRQLGRPRLHVIDTGLYREKLDLQVLSCVREGDKLARTLEVLQDSPGPGIVYCATVKACDELFGQLVAAGESVTRYHGRLPQAERTDNQDRFMRGELRVMVATNAFGMGIDKADLRFVLHYQMPGRPEAYYQEAGRAGRDGLAARATLLYDRRDRQVQQFFLVRRYPTADELRQVHQALTGAAAAQPLTALANGLPGLGRSRIAVSLQVLKQAGAARTDRHKAWQAGALTADTGMFERLATTYEERAERDYAALERMVFYAQTGYCRWRVLLAHFEESLPAADQRCGHCDNCLRPPPEAIEQPTSAAQRAATQPPRWAPGSLVSVPRYGPGEVVLATADEVEVKFTDGKVRSFVAAYVLPVANGLEAALPAPVSDNLAQAPMPAAPSIG